MSLSCHYHKCFTLLFRNTKGLKLRTDSERYGQEFRVSESVRVLHEADAKLKLNMHDIYWGKCLQRIQG